MKTTRRFLLPLLLLGSLFVAAPASAKFTIGLGDQRPEIFSNQLWKDLKLKKVRYYVPWDVALDPNLDRETDAFIGAARLAKQEIFIHFSARRGCFENNRYSKSGECKAPSAKKYTAAFKAFRKKYPFIKVYGTWNEANHVSQPTALKNSRKRGPKLVASYYRAMKRSCRKCKIVAGDLLDQSDLGKYAKALNKALKGRAKLWGLHNYGDVNRNRSKGTITMLKIVPGKLWLTETGGIVKFEGANNLKVGENEAVKALKNMFKLANKYDSKRKGYKSVIERLYPYNFREQESARFDAALLDPLGQPRKGYFTFKKGIKRAKR